MGSESYGGTSGFTPDQTLALLRADRARLVARLDNHRRWRLPLGALVAAIVVGAPAYGGVGVFSVVAALCSLSLWRLEGERNKRLGAEPTWPSTRRSMSFIVFSGSVYLAMIGASIGVAVAGFPQYSLAVAAMSFFVLLLLSWADERRFHAEVLDV